MNPKAAPSLRSLHGLEQSLMHPLIPNWERKQFSLRLVLSPVFSFRLSSPSFDLLRFSAPPGAYRSLLLLDTRKEVFVSSPSPQLCYETPSNPIRITDGRGGEAGGHGKWLPSSSFSFTSSSSFSTTDRWSSSTLVRDSLGFGSIPTLALQ